VFSFWVRGRLFQNAPADVETVYDCGLVEYQ
jgi:hypothetical protein